MKLSTLVTLLFAAVVFVATIPVATAHTVSNSYLTIHSVAGNSGEFDAQWDISLRDLQFVVGLDDNGDGRITWGELRHHQKQVADYAYSRIAVSAGGKRCTIKPDKQKVDTHADGAYAVLFFTVHCAAKNAHALHLDDRLLFRIDPTHRGVLVFRAGAGASTALVSPANHELDLKISAAGG
jgi:hypothetical protein